MTKHIRNQDGVTLFMSILVMSAISAVAFSLSAVTLVEIKGSTDVQRTEPALYSDAGITEEAIYGIKRGVSTSVIDLGPLCATNMSAYTGPLSTVSSLVRVCNVAEAKKFQTRVSPTAQDYNTARHIYLYDPDTLGQTPPPGGFIKVKVKNVSKTNTSVRVYICRLDQECAPPGTDLWLTNTGDGSAVMSPTDSEREYALNTAYSYDLAITNTSGTANDAVVEVTPEGPTAGTIKGIPYLNRKSVEIQSSISGLTRRLQVLIPVNQ